MSMLGQFTLYHFKISFFISEFYRFIQNSKNGDSINKSNTNSDGIIAATIVIRTISISASPHFYLGDSSSFSRYDCWQVSHSSSIFPSVSLAWYYFFTLDNHIVAIYFFFYFVIYYSPDRRPIRHPSKVWYREFYSPTGSQNQDVEMPLLLTSWACWDTSLFTVEISHFWLQHEGGSRT